MTHDSPPAVLIWALVSIVVWLVGHFVREARRAYVGSVLRMGRAAGDERTAQDLAAQFRTRDPHFAANAFEARALQAFFKVQRAWATEDLTPIRPFVSDGVHERLAMQIAERRALGGAERMSPVDVKWTRLAAISFSGKFDAATVEIGGRASGGRDSGETGIGVADSKESSRFSEYWTFLRRRGVQTKLGGAGLMEGACPNCGAPIEGNQFADCAACKSHLRSGEHDWVLVEIAQDGAWQPSKYRRLMELSTGNVVDPEFCVEVVEDRAAVTFWRWATAARTADADLVAGFATEEVVRTLAASFASASGARTFVAEHAVGGVELLGVARDAGMDFALVEISWSATNCVAVPGGRPHRLLRTGTRTTLFAFERKSGTKTRIQDGFSSAHCAGCGAPAEGTSAVCTYCKRTLADVNMGWTLAQITTRKDAAGRVLLETLRRTAGVHELQEPNAPPIPVGVLAWAARVAAIDGVVNPRERAGLAELARRAGVRSERLEQILGEVRASGDGALVEPSSKEEAAEWLSAAARIAAADGFVSAAAYDLLLRLGAHAGMSEKKVGAAIAAAKTELLAEARAALATGARGSAGM